MSATSRAARVFLLSLACASAAFAGDDDEPADQDADDAKMLEQLLGGTTAGAPPEVKAVMKKMSDGDDVTPAEERVLQQWLLKKKGGGPPPTAHAVEGRPADAPDQCLGPTRLKALTDAEWKTLAGQLQASSVTTLGPKGVAELDAALARTKRPVEVADLGAVLFLGRAFTQAGYVLLVALARVPQDHVALSHLGLVLSAQGRADDALRVHLRAKDKAPKAALVQANAGHALLRAGDCVAAHAVFDVAEALAPAHGPTLAGQAMVAALEGRQDDATRYLRAARSQQHSPAAESVVEEARDETETPRPSTRPEPAPQPPARRPYWREVPPLEVSLPPTGVGIEQFVGNLGTGADWLADRTQELVAAGKRTRAAIEAVKAARTAQAQRLRLGPSATVPMPDSPAVSAYWAAYRDYDTGMRARTGVMKKVMDPALQDLGRRYGASIQQEIAEVQSRCGPRAKPECVKAVGYEFCLRRKAIASSALRDFEGTWSAYGGGTKQGLERFWTEAGRPMEAVSDPATKKMLYEFRRTILRRDLVALGGVVTAWRSGMATGVMETCVQPIAPEVPPRLADPPLVPGRSCPAGKLKLKAFVLSAEVSCDSVKTEFTCLAHVAVEESFTTGETTVYLGAGFEGDVGLAALGAKGGMYATVNAAGEVVDVGFYQTRSASLFGAELEFGGRIGLSGVQSGAAASVMTPGQVGVGAEVWSAPGPSVPF